jgi:hypothetical protein
MSWKRAPKRFGQQRLDFGGARAGEALEIALDFQRVLEHGQGVAVDVEMVVRALLDAAQPLQLGEDDRGQAEIVEQSQAAERVWAADQLAQLGQLPLAGWLRSAISGGTSQGDGVGVDLEPELAGQPGGPQQPQRVRFEARLSDGTQRALREVGEPAEGIDLLTRSQRHRDGTDREVALGEIGFDPTAPQGGDVDLPAAARGDDAPGAELGRQLEGVPAQLGGDRSRRRAGVADREVEVVDGAAEGGVPHGAADDPGAAVVRQRSPSRLDEWLRPQRFDDFAAHSPENPAIVIERGAAPERRSRR